MMVADVDTLEDELPIKASWTSIRDWDSRVRQHLGTRYDAIPNVFDWDCSITLHDRGVKTMESREYGKWRRSGVAFTPRQASYLACNRTLASGRTFSSASGDRNALIGYWGDIICSPYLAFGTDTSQCPELGRFTHGVKLWGGALISEVNVRRLLWQVVHGKPCPQSIAASPYSGTRDANSQDAKGEGCETIEEEAEEEEDEMKSEEEGHNLDGGQSEEEKKGEDSKNNKEKEDAITQNEHQNQQSTGCTSSTEGTSEASLAQQNEKADGATEENVVPAGDPNMEDASGSDARNLCEQFEVHFLPTNSFPELSVRMASHFAEPAQKISLIYVACSMLHLLASPHLRPPKEVISQSTGPEGEFHNAGLVGLTTPRCQLIIESVLYIVDLRPNQVEAYVKRATEMAADVGFKPSVTPDPLKDSHLFFIRSEDDVPQSGKN
ncbi:Dynein assembly factor 3, axonemal [Sparganum proliferum]